MSLSPSPRRALVHRIPPWVAIAGFVATVAVSSYRAVERGAFHAHGDPGRWAMTDFRDTLYYPAVAMMAGTNPWSTQLADDYPVQRPLPPYGPVVVLLHWPFGFLPVNAAEIAYFAVTIALTGVTALMALRAGGFEAGLSAVLTTTSLLLLSRPGHQNLLLGQSTLEVVLGCYLAFVYAERRPALAALGIVLASMKPQFAIPLVLLLLVRGDWRATVGGVVATGVLSLGTLLLAAGTDGPATWLAAIGRSNTTVSAAALAWTRVDVAFFVRHVLAFPGRAELVAGIAVLALGLWAFRRSIATARTNEPPRLADVLGCLTILLPLYHIAYDTLLLTLPVVAFVGAARRLPTRAHAALGLLLLVPFVNVLSAHTVVSRLVPGAPMWRLVTGTNALALLAALLLCAWLAAASPRAATQR